MRASRPSLSAARAWLRFVAALVLALLASDHVMPSLHHALVAHRMCAEHGRVEHVGALERVAVHHEERVAFEADPAFHDDQQGCDCVPASPPRAPLVWAPTFVGIAAPALDSPAVPYRAAASDADVVAFAPKQSPPA